MQSPAAFVLPRTLPGGLVLRPATGPQDLEAVLAGHLAGFGNEDEASLRANLFARPGGRPEDVLFVEDPATGQSVSSVSLIHGTWRYEGLSIPVAEVGIVSTRPECRGRHLVRELFAAYHHLAAQRGYPISIIAGIEHYYRQYGYEYVVPLGGGVRLRPEQIPDLPEGETSPWTVRPARPEEMPALLSFDAEEAASLGLCAGLSEEIWRYQDGLPAEARERRATFIVEKGGLPGGFLRTWARPIPEWGEGVQIQAAHLPHRDACLAALRWARDESRTAHEGRSVRVELCHDAPLVQAAKDLGGEVLRPYGWQVRVLDPVALMMRIAPALERRLAASPLASLSDTFSMRLGREALVLRFREGCLQNAALLPRPPRRDVTLPPHVAPMVWFGWRSIQEVWDWYPDATVHSPAAGRLADVLFPKRPAWVCSLF